MYCPLPGKEFQVIFLSTTEPVDCEGNTTNPTKSPCDPYVFNTVLTRSKSLVVVVGSPVALLRIEKHMVKLYGRKAQCWSNYLNDCLENETFSIPPELEPDDGKRKAFKLQLSKVLKSVLDTNEELVISLEKKYSDVIKLSLNTSKSIEPHHTVSGHNYTGLLHTPHSVIEKPTQIVVPSSMNATQTPSSKQNPLGAPRQLLGKTTPIKLNPVAITPTPAMVPQYSTSRGNTVMPQKYTAPVVSSPLMRGIPSPAAFSYASRLCNAPLLGASQSPVLQNQTPSLGSPPNVPPVSSSHGYRKKIVPSARRQPGKLFSFVLFVAVVLSMKKFIFHLQ